ncbi:MAG: AI-2E family transporter [Microthrixaceae bacterium]
MNPGPVPRGWNETRPPRWLPRAVIVAMLGVAGFMLGRSIVAQLRDLLTILFAALFLSFAVEPAVDWLAERGWRRGVATGLVFLGILVVASLLVWAVVGLVVDQFRTLIDDAPRLIQNATRWLNRRFDVKITTDGIVEQLKRYQGDLASTAGGIGGQVLSVTGSVVGAVFNLFTVGLFSFYLIADGPKLRRSLCSVLPRDRQVQVLDLWELAIQKTGGYLYSRLLLAAASTLTSWLVLAVVGVPSPLPLALWMGIVSQFVPVVGTYIGGALPLLIALTHEAKSAIAVLIFLAVYQQVENYLLAPRVSAKTMEMHPAVAFGAAIAGASLMGPVGALLALPVAAIIQAFVSSYLERHEVVDNDLVTTESEGPGDAEAGAEAVADAGQDGGRASEPQESAEAGGRKNATS